MKVAILSRNFSKISGGAESFAVQLATAMRSECDITVISQSFDESHALFRHIAVPKLPIRSRWINQLWYNWFSKKVSRQGFDIVHSHENVTHGNVQTVHVKTVHASLNQKGMSRFRILSSPRLLAYLWIEKNRLCSTGHQNVFVSELLLDENSTLPTFGIHLNPTDDGAKPELNVAIAKLIRATRSKDESAIISCCSLSDSSSRFKFSSVAMLSRSMQGYVSSVGATSAVN